MRPAAILRDDPKLARIAAALRAAFGTRLASALLFGSRARGDHTPESDYDVAVFLEGYERSRDYPILQAVREQLGEEVWTLQFWPFGKDGLAERTTLMFNIRNEGVPLPGLAWPAIIAPSISPDEGPITPEAIALIRHAETVVASARKITAIGIYGSAAREAYRAALLAARAIIFQELRLAPKTHYETEKLFRKLAIEAGRIDEDGVSILSTGYRLQIDNDYEPIPTTSDQQAAEYVERADQFISAVKALIQ